MKSILLSVTLVAMALPTAASATVKTCYGSTKAPQTNGAVVTIDVNAKQIVIKTVVAAHRSSLGDNYDGTYPSTNTTTKAHTGKIYLNYLGENVDQQDYIMVDEDLLKPGTTGLLQIRSRGEGCFNSVYVCRDTK